MSKKVRLLAGLLLLVNGIGAIAGGTNFIIQPDGSGMGMPLVYLRHSPFTSFFFPGLVLLACNGVGSFIVLTMLMRRRRMYPVAVAAQGAVLLGWIVIQVAMLRLFNPLHAVFGGIGLVLIACGGWLWHHQARC